MARECANASGELAVLMRVCSNGPQWPMAPADLPTAASFRISRHSPRWADRPCRRVVPLRFESLRCPSSYRCLSRACVRSTRAGRFGPATQSRRTSRCFATECPGRPRCADVRWQVAPDQAKRASARTERLRLPRSLSRACASVSSRRRS